MRCVTVTMTKSTYLMLVYQTRQCTYSNGSHTTRTACPGVLVCPYQRAHTHSKLFSATKVWWSSNTHTGNICYSWNCEACRLTGSLGSLTQWLGSPYGQESTHTHTHTDSRLKVGQLAKGYIHASSLRCSSSYISCWCVSQDSWTYQSSLPATIYLLQFEKQLPNAQNLPEVDNLS